LDRSSAMICKGQMKVEHKRSRDSPLWSEMSSFGDKILGVWRGVSKGVEDGRVEGSGMAGQGETLGRPWPALSMEKWMGIQGLTKSLYALCSVSGYPPPGVSAGQGVATS
jgi:hypothetical protein